MYLFLQKDFTRTSTKTQPSKSITKAQRRNQAKAQNADKRISAFFPLDIFMHIFYFCSL